MSQIREILRKQNHWFQETFWGKAGSSLYNESSQITSTHIIVNIVLAERVKTHTIEWKY